MKGPREVVSRLKQLTQKPTEKKKTAYEPKLKKIEEIVPHGQGKMKGERHLLGVMETPKGEYQKIT